MWFNKTMCKVLHLSQDNSWYQYRLGDEQMESSPAEKDLGELMDERLDMTRQCALAAQKASCILGCIKSNVGSRTREGILFSSGETHLEYRIQDWRPLHRKDTDLLESR
ncbi:hypothetical protein BTVI_37576 [Pitangus sulphuratus]|nr:hypothetical protein BTVI_37576 [Pitangus sulphuratus]